MISVLVLSGVSRCGGGSEDMTQAGPALTTGLASQRNKSAGRMLKLGKFGPQTRQLGDEGLNNNNRESSQSAKHQDLISTSRWVTQTYVHSEDVRRLLH